MEASLDRLSLDRVISFDCQNPLQEMMKEALRHNQPIYEAEERGNEKTKTKQFWYNENGNNFPAQCQFFDQINRFASYCWGHHFDPNEFFDAIRWFD